MGQGKTAERGTRAPDKSAKAAPKRAKRARRSGGHTLEQRLARVEESLKAQSEREAELLKRVSDSADLVRGAEQALQQRRENVVEVDQPLALISQAQRSGGTLLVRLFDGHPQCHV